MRLLGHRRLQATLLYLSVFGAALLVALPFIWALSTSLKSPDEIHVFPPAIVPASPQFANYIEVFQIVPLGLWFANTLVITILSLMGQLLVCSLVAYGFARFRFPYRNALFLLLLSNLLLPYVVTIVPQFILFKSLGWIDTFLPLVVPWWFAAGAGGAFSVFLLRQFYQTIPLELDEAARVDGAGPITIWWKILLPLSKPALTALTIFGFVWSWNDFLGPLLYLHSEDKLTISLGLQYLQTAGFQAFGSLPITDHLLMAATLLASVPPLLLFLVAQRQFIQGIALTGKTG